MKRLALVAGLALVGSALAVVPSLEATAIAPQPATPSIVSQMKAQASGTTRVSVEKATGKVAFIRTRAGRDLMPGVSGASASAAGAKADAYLAKYSSAFGAAKGELHRSGVTQNDLGFTVRYEQRYQGVPVFGSRVLANVDKAGHLRAVNGFAAPGLKLSTTPRLTPDEAAAAAVAQVRQDPPTTESGKKADLTGIKALAARLVIYRTGVTRGVDGVNTLAYAVQVSNKANVNDMVIVRADSTKVLNRWSQVAGGLDRTLFTCSPADLEDCDFTVVWEEGDPTGPLAADQKNLVESSGESYWLFANTFGRDSYDGEGGPMFIVHNRLDECPNASWNGLFTSFCPGMYSDDVVSHEWGHAYTQYTSNLIYQWQSGALNESYSDVWGETLDLINEREDEGEGDLTAKRPDGQCSTHMRAPIEAEITAPAEIAGPCAGAAAAAFGPRFTQTPTVADIEVATDAADDGDEGDGTTSDGCSAFDDPQATEGTWAYVDRGACAFVQKTQNAIDAGYEGIVVGNNQPDAPFAMAGNFDDIYGVMVNQADGTKIKSAGEATISVVEAPTGERTESYRWLIGEKSPGGGGASRDMWNPTCAGNAGKVSDAEYFCGFDDGGGVHSNSGVPNHTYALTVDGGTYNAQTLDGIGLDKAAAIWFRAQSQYLTPVSDFPDLGNALAASCEDLVGQRVVELSVEVDAAPVLTDPVTSTDCVNLGKAIVATELADDAIEQCDYQPLLDQDAPAACGDGFTTTTVWSEDFEDGLAGWGTDQDIVFEGGIAAPWEATTDAPGNHPGGVAYGPLPDLGNCSEGEGPGDFSSRDSIISPAVTVPAAGRNPLLSFDHYVATELLYDGVSLAYSKNGGAFSAVPPDAYVFNPPTVDELPADPGPGPSTNPLVGSPAWTGTDDGHNKGTWGRSQVSLTALGAAAGDQLRFRFDAARDGCGGVDGWYVDNVTVTVCEADQPPATKVATTTSVKKPANPPRFRQDFQVKVIVKAEGLTPTGQVVIKYQGVTIGKGKLVDGRVRIKITKNLKVGRHELVAKYQGSSTAKPSKKRFTIRIVKG